MKTILVTGGAGYVGSHTCKALTQQGFFVVSYDNLSTGFAQLVKWGPLEVGDLLDAASLKKVLQKYRPWGIVHFAAKSDVAESIRNPEIYYSNNIQGTKNLLQAMLQLNITRLIASSTCAIYGQPELNNLALDEQTPINPISPYGQSKWAMEQLLAEYQQNHGLKYTALRYFNAAGADLDLEIGECHQPETHLIPLALQSLKPEGKGLKIFGTDYPTPDGTCIRDYVHVSDLAKAHVLALENLDAPDQGATQNADQAEGQGATQNAKTLQIPSAHYNLGSESGYSVQEIITKIQEVTGKPVPHVLAERRPGDPPQLIASAKKAKTQLGWQPKLGLSEIISTAWQWEQKHHS